MNKLANTPTENERAASIPVYKTTEQTFSQYHFGFSHWFRIEQGQNHLQNLNKYADPPLSSLQCSTPPTQLSISAQCRYCRHRQNECKSSHDKVINVMCALTIHHRKHMQHFNSFKLLNYNSYTALAGSIIKLMLYLQHIHVGRHFALPTYESKTLSKSICAPGLSYST